VIAAADAGGSRLRKLHALLVATVVLFAAFIQFTVATRTTLEAPVQSDAIRYVTYAWNLRHYDTFSRSPFWLSTQPVQPVPDKLVLPGYPVFLDLFLRDKVDVAFVHKVVLAQAALGVVTCLMTLLLGLRLLPFGLAIAAGLLACLSPHLANISTDLLTESLFTALLTLSLVVVVRAAGRHSAWLAAAGGGLMGLASLVRPQMQLFPWLLLALCLLLPAWRVHARKVVFGLLCFVAVTLPWNLRNASVERPAGDPDLFAMTLYHGGFPGLMYDNRPETAGYPYKYDALAEQHSKDVPSALRFIGEGFAAHPGRYLAWYLVGKPLSFLAWTDPANATDVDIYPATATPYRDQPMFRFIKRAMRWLHWPVTALALLALPIAALRPDWLANNDGLRLALRLLALALAYVLVIHMIGAPFGRYSVPFRPLVYVLAMATTHALWRGYSSRNRAPDKNLTPEVKK
jgi:4-amino-4-deoxy-L-arabinose transferase-like glycosyltransferase